MFHCLILLQKYINKNYLELCNILVKIAKIHKGKAEPEQMNFASVISLTVEYHLVFQINYKMFKAKYSLGLPTLLFSFYFDTFPSFISVHLDRFELWDLICGSSSRLKSRLISPSSLCLFTFLLFLYSDFLPWSCVFPFILWVLFFGVFFFSSIQSIFLPWF